jgi:catechol 2,3-dioxygenase-like lactoylglutathione lyase family enzyme
MAKPSVLCNSKLMAFAATIDPARAKQFYAEALGLNLVSEDAFALVFDANGTPLRVSTVREMIPAPYTVLGWEVRDIVGAVEELKSAGIVFERYPGIVQDEHAIWTAPGSAARVAWFKDPDGNILSVSQHG